MQILPFFTPNFEMSFKNVIKIDKFIIISYSILEKFKNLKILTYSCFPVNKNAKLSSSVYRRTRIENLDADPNPDADPKFLIFII